MTTWTCELWDERWRQLRVAVPDLSEAASVNAHRCGTCVRCQETFGMRSIFEAGFDRKVDGGHHYDLLFTGEDRVFGGRSASAIGRTDGEAWDNLMRALA